MRQINMAEIGGLRGENMNVGQGVRSGVTNLKGEHGLINK